MNLTIPTASLMLVLTLPAYAQPQYRERMSLPVLSGAYYGEPADSAFVMTETSYGARQSHSERASMGLFDDTGELPCSVEPGQPLQHCAFGVAREQGGNASLRIQLPDGHERLIVFAQGEPLAANLDEEQGENRFVVRRERHAYLIHTGQERFAIPDMLITAPPNHPG